MTDEAHAKLCIDLFSEENDVTRLNLIELVSRCANVILWFISEAVFRLALSPQGAGELLSEAVSLSIWLEQLANFDTPEQLKTEGIAVSSPLSWLWVITDLYRCCFKHYLEWMIVMCKLT